MRKITPTQDDIEAALARIPYAVALGLKPLLMGDELTLIMPSSAHIIGNPMLEALHGGAVGAFMETTALASLYLRAPDRGLAKPIDINIDYLKRGKPQDTYARAAVTRQGSRVTNVRVRAWQDNFDDPISLLHGNFMRAPAEENPGSNDPIKG